MSSAPTDPAHDNWLSLLDALDRHLQQLIDKTTKLSAALAPLRDVAQGREDVLGYLAGRAAPPPAATDLDEMVASLDDNGQLLQRVAVRLEQLRAFVEALPDKG